MQGERQVGEGRRGNGAWEWTSTGPCRALREVGAIEERCDLTFSSGELGGRRQSVSRRVSEEMLYQPAGGWGHRWGWEQWRWGGVVGLEGILERFMTGEETGPKSDVCKIGVFCLHWCS